MSRQSRNDKPASCWYRNRRSLIYLGIGLSLASPIISAIYRVNDRSRLNEVTYINANICHQHKRIMLAEQLGIAYQWDNEFESLAIRVTADADTLAEFDSRYEAYSQEVQQSEIDKACHLTHVKYHVDNINDDLLPYIPNDADHVSYDPKGNNAVYCHYLTGNQSGSQCFYIRLEADRLSKDDISGLERLNLQTANSLYALTTDGDKFHCVRSFVTHWTDKSTNDYGFTLKTVYNGNCWGIEQDF